MTTSKRKQEAHRVAKLMHQQQTFLAGLTAEQVADLAARAAAQQQAQAQQAPSWPAYDWRWFLGGGAW